MKALFDSIRAGGSPGLSEFVDALGERVEALGRLAETPQDPTWHAEGDVLTHTEMVLSEAYELLEGPASYGPVFPGSSSADFGVQEVDVQSFLVTCHHPDVLNVALFDESQEFNDPFVTVHGAVGRGRRDADSRFQNLVHRECKGAPAVDHEDSAGAQR